MTPGHEQSPSGRPNLPFRTILQVTRWFSRILALLILILFLLFWFGTRPLLKQALAQMETTLQEMGYTFRYRDLLWIPPHALRISGVELTDSPANLQIYIDHFTLEITPRRLFRLLTPTVDRLTVDSLFLRVLLSDTDTSYAEPETPEKPEPPDTGIQWFFLPTVELTSFHLYRAHLEIGTRSSGDSPDIWLTFSLGFLHLFDLYTRDSLIQVDSLLAGRWLVEFQVPPSSEDTLEPLPDTLWSPGILSALPIAIHIRKWALLEGRAILPDFFPNDTLLLTSLYVQNITFHPEFLEITDFRILGKQPTWTLTSHLSCQFTGPCKISSFRLSGAGTNLSLQVLANLRNPVVWRPQVHLFPLTAHLSLSLADTSTLWRYLLRNPGIPSSWVSLFYHDWKTTMNLTIDTPALMGMQLSVSYEDLPLFQAHHITDLSYLSTGKGKTQGEIKSFLPAPVLCHLLPGLSEYLCQDERLPYLRADIRWGPLSSFRDSFHHHLQATVSLPPRIDSLTLDLTGGWTEGGILKGRVLLAGSNFRNSVLDVHARTVELWFSARNLADFPRTSGEVRLHAHDVLLPPYDTVYRVQLRGKTLSSGSGNPSRLLLTGEIHSSRLKGWNFSLTSALDVLLHGQLTPHFLAVSVQQARISSTHTLEDIQLVFQSEPDRHASRLRAYLVMQAGYMVYREFHHPDTVVIAPLIVEGVLDPVLEDTLGILAHLPGSSIFHLAVDHPGILLASVQKNIASFLDPHTLLPAHTGTLLSQFPRFRMALEISPELARTLEILSGHTLQIAGPVSMQIVHSRPDSLFLQVVLPEMHAPGWKMAGIRLSGTWTPLSSRFSLQVEDLHPEGVSPMENLQVHWRGQGTAGFLRIEAHPLCGYTHCPFQATLEIQEPREGMPVILRLADLNWKPPEFPRWTGSSLQGDSFCLPTWNLCIAPFEIRSGDTSWLRLLASEESGYWSDLQIHRLALHPLWMIIPSGNVKGGIAGGSIQVSRDFRRLRFTEFTVSALWLDTLQLPDLQLTGVLSIPEASVNLQLFAGEGQIHIYGSLEPEKPLFCRITALDLSLAQPFLSGILDNIQGNLWTSQPLRITTLPSPPYFLAKGEGVIQDMRFTVSYTGVHYRSPRLLLHFHGDSLRLQGVLEDTAGGFASILGYVHWYLPEEVEYSIRLVARNIIGIHATAEENPDYYGFARVSGQVTLRGNLQEFWIQLDSLVPASLSTIYMPIYTGPYVEEDINWITFREKKPAVDTVQMDETKQQVQALQEESAPSSFGIGFLARLYLDDRLSLVIPFDPPEGDILTVAGNGFLQMLYTPEGSFSMHGTYRITDGTYRFNYYGLIVKDFLIQEGEITWVGDPYTARMDLTTIYRVKASTYNLLLYEGGRGVSGKSPSSIPSAAEESSGGLSSDVPPYVTAVVTLRIQGTLEQPLFSFDLDIEEAQNYPRLRVLLQALEQNPQERDYQVFALLAFNQFAPPRQSGEGGTFAGGTNIYQTMSHFVSQQLTELAQQLLGDESLQLTLAYTSGGKTEEGGKTRALQFGVTKTLGNQRLLLDIGGTIAGTGSSRTTSTGASSSSHQSAFSGTVQLEYLLTPDGRWRWRLFSETRQTTTGKQGYYTGMGIRYIRTFNRWTELLPGRQKKEDEKRPPNHPSNKPTSRISSRDESGTPSD